MKFSICNEIFQGWEIEDVFRTAAEIGYQAVEIAPFTLFDSVTELSAERRKEIRRCAADYGIEVAGLHWLLVKPEGLAIITRDAALRQRTQDYFLELIRCCADLGGRVLVIGSPKQRMVPEGMTQGEAFEMARDFFAGCAGLARECGVVLCMEPLSPAETNFINTAASAIKLVDAVGHPSFRIVLDVKAMSSEGTPLPEIIRKSIYYPAHIHANDANLRGPGFGEVDFVPIFKALRRIAYHGYISVEVFDFAPDPVTIATKSLEYMRKCLAEAISNE